MNETPPIESTPQPAKPPSRFGIKHLLSLLFAAGVTLSVYLLRNEIGRLGRMGYLGIFAFMVLTSATLILPTPALALVFVLGRVFNPLVLGIVAGAGSALGEITGYLAGYSGSGVIENAEVYQRIEGYVKKYGVIPIIILGAFPNPVFDVAGIAAGALHMGWWKFLLATFVGKTIKMIYVAYAGLYSLAWIERFIK
jgi:membrane protein YqaA with SNARE-associated domain